MTAAQKVRGMRSLFLELLTTNGTNDRLVHVASPIFLFLSPGQLFQFEWRALERPTRRIGTEPRMTMSRRLKRLEMNR